MRTDNPAFAAANQSASKRPIYVVEQSFDFANEDRCYFTSHLDAATPEGAQVFAGCVGKIASTSQEINPDKAVSTIGAISIELVDLGGQLTALFAAKSAGGDGLRQKRARVYVGYEGLAWEDYQIVATQVVDDLRQDGGAYELRCADIQRTVRKDIFTLAKTSLSASVDATQLLIPVYSVDAFKLVAHGPSYTDRPNAAMGYIQIDDEIIRWSGTTQDPSLGLCFVVDSFVDSEGVTRTGRGALNTQAAEHTVDPEASKDRRTEVLEYVYLEMPAVKLAYALLTGALYNQPGERLPDGWHLGVPGQYIRTADFTGIGGDWWNPDDDTQGIIVRFAGLEKQDGKQFIEQELCLLLAAFMPVHADGQLGLQRMTSVLSGLAGVMELDESSVVSHGDLHIDTKSVHNVLSVLWNYRPEQENYSRQNLLLDPQSIAKYGRAPVKEVRFKGLHGSRHTDAVISGLFDRLRDRYAGPPLRLSLKVLPSRNTLEVGDVVRVRLPTLRDPIAGGTLDRAFEVQQVRIDWHTGEVNLKLFGSSEAAGPIQTGNADGGPSLPDSFYTERGTNLATYPGVTIEVVGEVGHIRGGSGLVGGDTLEEGRFYYDGDLELDAGVTLPFSRNVMLCIKGHFQINGTLDGAGRGLPGAEPVDYIDELQPLEPAYSRHNPGVPGYIGGCESGGGFYFAGRLSARSAPGFKTGGAVASVPPISLSVTEAGLSGLPKNLQGSSGATGRSYMDAVRQSGGDQYFANPGGAGGAGGAGVAIVARGISFGQSGAVNTSGADGTQAPTPARTTTPVWWSGTGAGGAPGAALFVVDGGSSAIPGLASVQAKFGASPPAVVPPGFYNSGQTARPFRQPVTAGTEWDGATPYAGCSYYIGYGNNPPNLSGPNGGAARVLFVPPTDQQEEQDVPDVAPQPLTVSVVEYINTPRSPAGDRSTLEVTVGRPNSGAYAYANIYYRIKGGGAWELAGAADDERTIVVASDGTSYEVQARSVSISGQESPSGPVASITVSRIDDPYAIAAPTQLRAESGTAHLLMARDGTIVSRIYLTWNPVTHSSLAGYEVEHRLAGETVWAERQTVTDPSAYIYAAKDGQAYELRVRAITSVAKSDWVQVAHTVIGKTEPPANVTGFSAYQNGPSAVLRWRQVPDRDLAGYKLRFMGQSAPFSWSRADDLTDLVRGTEITTAGLAPGTWFVGIKAVDTSGNESPTAAITTVEIRNSNDAIYVRPQAPDWPGVLEGFEVVNGALQLAPGLPPDGQAIYTAPYIDMAFMDTVRAWAEVRASAAGAADPDPDLQLRHATGLADDEPMWVEGDDDEPMWTEGDDIEAMWQGWAEWRPWTVGEVYAELIQFRLVRDVAEGDLSVKAFTPILDVPPRSESARGIAVPAGGATILFSRPFHFPPVVQITTSGGALIPSVTNETTLGFDVALYALDGTPTAGTINWTASTE